MIISNFESYSITVNKYILKLKCAIFGGTIIVAPALEHLHKESLFNKGMLSLYTNTESNQIFLRTENEQHHEENNHRDYLDNSGYTSAATGTNFTVVFDRDNIEIR